MSNDRARRALLLIALLVALGSLVACGEQGGANYTPPPATIIRSSDQATPTAAQAAPAQQGQPAAAQSAVPAPVAGETAYPYPFSVSTPGPSSTPEVYPTPGK